MTLCAHLPPSFSSMWIVFLTLEMKFGGVSSNNDDSEHHLEMGKDLIAKGQFADALSHFHAAIERDPNNYLSYYRRATVYLALGKSKSALPDLDKVIELKSDFTAAQLQRGSVFLKQGRLDEAHIDFENVLRRDPQNAEALRQYTLVEPLKQEIHYATQLINGHDYQNALPLLDRVIENCPWDYILREMRAESLIQLGDYARAMNDLRSTTKLRTDSTTAHYKLSKLHYEIGDADESLIEIRECLKLDPDHQTCFTHYKKMKKLVAQLNTAQSAKNEGRVEDCEAAALKVLKLEPDLQVYHFKAYVHLCSVLRKTRPLEALGYCNKALQIEEDTNILCDRADAHIQLENWDDASRDYQQALKLDEGMKRAQEGHQRAQKLAKQASKRDYYKILGVKRSATKKEVTKAYRKLAQQWHPDNFPDEEERKRAEKKFIDIASAKEVLTDPEKRSKFDSGEDPLDPESQQGQGFPFHQGGGFHFQGGQPFQFKFHFN